MIALIKTLETSLFHHRIGVLWVGFIVTSAWLGSGLSADHLARYPMPYPIREVLINYADGLVRRGLGGSVSLGLAGTFGGAPGVWAWAILVAALGCLVGLSARLYRRLPQEPSLVLLVLAPTGLLFLAYDPEGSIRKEVFGYLALALVLQGVLAKSATDALRWAVGGGLVFVISIWIHEAILVMWPVYGLSLALLGWQWTALRNKLALLALSVGALSLLSGLYVLQLPMRDPLVLCAAVGDVACDGPFSWLATTKAEGIAYTMGRRVRFDLVMFTLYAVAGLLPFMRIKVGAGAWIGPLVIGIACVSVAPLFIVAYDWGRWIQMAVFPLSLLAVAGIQVGLVTVKRLLPSWLVLIYVGSWALPHAHATIFPAGVWIWPVLALLIMCAWLVSRFREGP